MDRRQLLTRSVAILLGAATVGCRTTQHARVMKECQADKVGSHAAGAETFKPLIEESVGKLLARQNPASIQTVSGAVPGPKRICFVGLENKSAEELGDFKEQIVQIIDNHIVQSKAFQPISPRFVQRGLQEARLRPDDLFLPDRQRMFTAVMEQAGQPFDYLLFATLTSGTTRGNGDYQRDYLLTLDLVDIHTGTPDKESATVRKGYHSSRIGAMMNR